MGTKLAQDDSSFTSVHQYLSSIGNDNISKKTWVKDVGYMHKHYGIKEKLKTELSKLTPLEQSIYMKKLLEFRGSFIQEEAGELEVAIKTGDSEGVVDALIDICVVAIGTLDLFEVDSEQAWDEIYRANMSKRVGIKPSRPNPLGLPDLIKPEGWVEPSHKGNHGNLP